MNIAKLAVSAALVAGVAIGGSGLCSNQSAMMQSPNSTVAPRVVRRSLIKVHTDRGVITLPAAANSWDAIENAVFVADSIADVQIVNNEVLWRISYE